MRKEKYCLNCNKKYINYKKTSKYCSFKCGVLSRKSNTKLTFKCLHCNKILENIYGGAKRKYCSKECSAHKFEHNKYIRINKNYCNPKLRETIICVNCGKVVENILKSSSRKFCSSECNGIYGSKKRSLKNIPKIQKQCLYCYKQYEVWNYRKNSEFCSKKCHYKYGQNSLICPCCNKRFYFQKHKSRKYCSDECNAKGCLKRKSQFSESVSEWLKNQYPSIKIENEKYLKTDLKKCFLDFLLEDYLAIECDGKYWHCDCRYYSPDYFHLKVRKTAKEIWEEDDKKDIFVKSFGYSLIRLKEMDWKIEPILFFKELKERIDEIFKSRVD